MKWLRCAECSRRNLSSARSRSVISERYERLKMQLGILIGRVVPELVDKAEAEGELKIRSVGQIVSGNVKVKVEPTPT